jgi:hypothetical protein
VKRPDPDEVHLLTELLASGKLRPATASRPVHRPSGAVRTDREAGELLRELRDDERY